MPIVIGAVIHDARSQDFGVTEDEDGFEAINPRYELTVDHGPASSPRIESAVVPFAVSAGYVGWADDPIAVYLYRGDPLLHRLREGDRIDRLQWAHIQNVAQRRVRSHAGAGS